MSHNVWNSMRNVLEYTEDKEIFDTEVKTRIPLEWRKVLDEIAEEQEVSLSYLVRKCLYEQLLIDRV